MTLAVGTALEFSDFAIIAGIVVIFGGAAAFGSRVPSDLRRIERKLDALLKQQGVSVPFRAPLSEEVKHLARDPSRKIEAIKLHRTQTGLGLAEAKSDIEDFMRTT